MSSKNKRTRIGEVCLIRTVDYWIPSHVVGISETIVRLRPVGSSFELNYSIDSPLWKRFPYTKEWHINKPIRWQPAPKAKMIKPKDRPYHHYDPTYWRDSEPCYSQNFSSPIMNSETRMLVKEKINNLPPPQEMYKSQNLTNPKSKSSKKNKKPQNSKKYLDSGLFFSSSPLSRQLYADGNSSDTSSCNGSQDIRTSPNKKSARHTAEQIAEREKRLIEFSKRRALARLRATEAQAHSDLTSKPDSSMKEPEEFHSRVEQVTEDFTPHKPIPDSIEFYSQNSRSIQNSSTNEFHSALNISEQGDTSEFFSALGDSLSRSKRSFSTNSLFDAEFEFFSCASQEQEDFFPNQDSKPIEYNTNPVVDANKFAEPVVKAPLDPDELYINSFDVRAFYQAFAEQESAALQAERFRTPSKYSCSFYDESSLTSFETVSQYSCCFVE